METITVSSYIGIIGGMVVLTVSVVVAAHFIFKIFVRKQ